MRTARHRWCRQRIFPLLAVNRTFAWFAGRAQAKGKAEVLKRIAPVARSVSWNVTAVAGNAWIILTPRTDSQNKATPSVAGGLAQRVCDFLDTHLINYQTCRARAIGASSLQMVIVLLTRCKRSSTCAGVIQTCDSHTDTEVLIQPMQDSISVPSCAPEGYIDMRAGVLSNMQLHFGCRHREHSTAHLVFAKRTRKGETIPQVRMKGHGCHTQERSSTTSSSTSAISYQYAHHQQRHTSAQLLEQREVGTIINA